MPDSAVPITAGTGTNIDTITTPSGDHRQVVICSDKGGHTGRAASFRIPGRAGTAGQRLFSIHNATGSTVAVALNRITVDLQQTVIKAVAVAPPMIRLYKVTVLPTNGTAVTKVSEDSAGVASSSSVTILQDASADGVSSNPALTATLPAGAVITQEYAPRLITAVGYEMADRLEFLTGTAYITLHALEGVVLALDYVLATQNPITDQWLVTCQWEEFVP